MVWSKIYTLQDIHIICLGSVARKQLFEINYFLQSSWIWRTKKRQEVFLCVLWSLGQRKQTACKHKSQKQYTGMTLRTGGADSLGVTAHSRTLGKVIQDRRGASGVCSESFQISQSRLQTWGHLFSWTATCFDSFHRFETETTEYCTQNYRPARVSSPLISRL